MNRLRGAILGCGMIAEFHLRAWLRIPDVEIVALCDPEMSRASQRQSEFVPAALLYEDLDVDSIDAVDLIVELRNITGKQIDPEVFKSVRTVDDVVNAVVEILGTE